MPTARPRYKRTDTDVNDTMIGTDNATTTTLYVVSVEKDIVIFPS